MITGLITTRVMTRVRTNPGIRVKSSGSSIQKFHVIIQNSSFLSMENPLLTNINNNEKYYLIILNFDYFPSHRSS